MQVFISWSGPKSHRLAEAFNECLPYFLHSIKPFVSFKDIEKGTLWLKELVNALDAGSVGIICVTPDSFNQPWLLFETGALFRLNEKHHVFPVLFDISAKQLQGSPLQALFNLTQCNEEEIKKLIKSLNAIAPTPIDDNTLNVTFSQMWHFMKSHLDEMTVGPTGLSLSLDIPPNLYTFSLFALKLNVFNTSGKQIRKVRVNCAFPHNFPGDVHIEEISHNGVLSKADGHHSIEWIIPIVEPAAVSTVQVTCRAYTEEAVRVIASLPESEDHVLDVSFNAKAVSILEVSSSINPELAEIGTDVTFDVYATNRGNKVEADIATQIIIPPQMQFKRAVGPTTSIIHHEDRVVTFGKLPYLAPCARATWTVECTALEVSKPRFVAFVDKAYTQEPPIIESQSLLIFKKVMVPDVDD